MSQRLLTYISPEEAASLKKYLLKGGFLWADDFWGEYAWAHWETELRKVLPAAEYPLVDVPLTHGRDLEVRLLGPDGKPVRGAVAYGHTFDAAASRPDALRGTPLHQETPGAPRPELLQPLADTAMPLSLRQ